MFKSLKKPFTMFWTMKLSVWTRSHVAFYLLFGRNINIKSYINIHSLFSLIIRANARFLLAEKDIILARYLPGKASDNFRRPCFLVRAYKLIKFIKLIVTYECHRILNRPTLDLNSKLFKNQKAFTAHRKKNLDNGHIMHMRKFKK